MDRPGLIQLIIARFHSFDYIDVFMCIIKPKREENNNEHTLFDSYSYIFFSREYRKEKSFITSSIKNKVYGLIDNTKEANVRISGNLA